MERELDDGDWQELAAAIAKPLPEEPRRQPRGWRTSPRMKVNGRVVIALCAIYWAVFLSIASPRDWFRMPGFIALLAAFACVNVPGGVRDALRSRACAARAAWHPDAPWLADHPWDSKGTTVSVLQRMLAPGDKQRNRGRRFLVFFSGMYCVIELVSGDTPWIAATSGGVFLFLVSWRWWREHGIGDGHVWYSRFPFHPGEKVTLYFGMSEGGATFERATFHLRAIEETTHGGLGVPNSTVVTWMAREHRPPGPLPGPRTDVQLAFDLPDDAPGTQLSAVDPHYWVLEVVANTSAGPYFESFLVPIYARPAA